MAVAAGSGMSQIEKLHASGAWQRIRGEFDATGDAFQVQRELSRTIDAMAIDAFASTLGAALPSRIADLPEKSGEAEPGGVLGLAQFG